MGNLDRPLVLGSTSRYRRELLARLRLPFEVDAPDVDETPRPGEVPSATALRLAEAKARAVAARWPRAWIIGSDQVADCEGDALSKPETHERAVEQLVRLSGKTIVFHTAVALLDSATGRCETRLVDVASTFRVLSRERIEAYLRLEQPYDCAGSMRSEALGIALCERIASDDPTALVGLPLIALADLLARFGVDVIAAAAAAR